MRIFFCDKCSARLSNGDIERGDAVVYEGEVYCYHCVPEGVDPDSLPKPKKKGSQFNLPAVKRRPKSSTNLKPRPRRSPGGGIRGAKKPPGAAAKPRPGSSARTRPASATRTRAPSSSRTRPPSNRQRPVGPAISLSPKGVVLMAAALGVAVATVAFFTMRALS